MFLQLLLVFGLQQFTVQYSGFSTAERCNEKKNNECENGFAYIVKEDTCIDVKHFSCPKNTGKVFEFVHDPYLCNVIHACHKGTEIDRICCSSTEIFSITQRSCIQVTDTNKGLLGNCATDSCAELMATEVCKFKFVMPILVEYPTEVCTGITTVEAISTTTLAGNTETQGTSTSPQTTTLKSTIESTGTQGITSSPQTTTLKSTIEVTGTQEITSSPQTTTLKSTIESTGTQGITSSSQTTTLKSTIESTGTQEITSSPQTTTLISTIEITGTQEITSSPQTTTLKSTIESTGTQGITSSSQTTTLKSTIESTGPQETTLYPSTSAKPGPPEECTSENEGVYYCDPENPHGFYYCSDGVLIYDTCIGINVFDCQYKACVPPSPSNMDMFQLLLYLVED